MLTLHPRDLLWIGILTCIESSARQSANTHTIY